MRKFLVLLISLSLFFGMDFSVQAQSLARADLYPADSSAFPTISALLDVYDSNGIFASGLQAEAVTVLEDGLSIPASSLNEQAVPLQIVVAVNQGPSLDARDNTGLARFQRVSQLLIGWAQTRPAGLPDDFSLVSQAGQVIAHASAADFVVSLNSFQPDFRAAAPNLQSLNIAIDTASQQTPLPGMKRAVLFITPHMDDPNIANAIQPYLQLAKDNGVRVFVWYVDTNTFFTTTSAAAFNSLAMESGGKMFGYSGVERFPDPEEYFSSLRRIFVLTYKSSLISGGQHRLSVQVNLPSGMVNSADQFFSVEIQPPNPIFVKPPMQITRQAPAEDPFNTDELLPTEQKIDIIIEFPDAHERPLVRTTLYVDGQVQDENTSEPFDAFTWDLTPYQLSGGHQLIVEVVDSLGLKKSSISIPVTVTVIQPPRGAAALLAKYRQWITIGAIAIAGLALLIMLLFGRVRIPSLRKVREARRAHEDPLTQPIQVVEETPSQADKEKTAPRRRAPARKTTPRPRVVDAPASFIRIGQDGQPVSSNPIALPEKEIAIGVDPVQANHVLDDPSIAPLHARIRQTDDGGYLIFDNNSIAGTWVNFEPVPREGYRLAHGDVVHFGQLIFRFTLRTPPTAPKPKMTVQKPEE